MTMKVRVLDTPHSEFQLINLARFPDSTQGNYAEIPRSLFTAFHKAEYEYYAKICEIRRFVDAQKK